MTLMKQVADIDDRRIKEIFSIGSERQRMVLLGLIRWHFYVTLSLVVQHCYLSQEAINSVLDLVLKRKAISAEALAAQHEVTFTGKYPQLEPKLRELRILTIQIGNELLDGTGHVENLISQQKYLEELSTQKEQLEEYLAHNIPEITLEQKLQTANCQVTWIHFPTAEV